MASCIYLLGLDWIFHFPYIILRRSHLVRIFQQAGAGDGGGLDKVVAWDEDFSQINSICVHSSMNLIACRSNDKEERRNSWSAL